MAGAKKGSEDQYVMKKDGSDNPVDACKGWFDPCEYCDKRFSEWIPADEEVYEKIPEKPGFFMIGLKNKNVTEVVSILYNESSIQKTAVSEIDRIRDQVSNKKIKATKSEVLVRWMVVKKVGDKDSIILCCHWNNNGVLPRYLSSWPGQSLMEGNEIVFHSKQIQKWCYQQKNPVWRKAKPPPSKNMEEVKKCNFQSCEVCDSYFTPWKSLVDVVQKDLAPQENGLVMLSAVYGKQREVLGISSERNSVVSSIKETVKKYESNEKYHVKNTKFENKNVNFEVRWTVIKNVDSDNACFLFAHFHNADEWPKYNAHYRMLKMNELGEMSLNKNKHFVFRNNDQKWFYETEALKPAKFSKAKNRKQLLDELYDEENYETELS